PAHVHRKLARHQPARRGTAGSSTATAGRTPVLLDPVAGGGERALFGGAGAEQGNQGVEPVCWWQHLTGEILPDDPVRPARGRGQVAVGEAGAALLPAMPAAQRAQQRRELWQRPYPGGVLCESAHVRAVALHYTLPAGHVRAYPTVDGGRITGVGATGTGPHHGTRDQVAPVVPRPDPWCQLDVQGCPFRVKPDGGLNGLTEPSKPTKVSPPGPIVALYEAAVRVPPVAVRVSVPPKVVETVVFDGIVNVIDQLLSGAAVLLMIVT